MNNLPTDILNCEVCRQRLGLPPLNVLANSATSTTNSFVLPKPPVLPKEPAIDSEGERLELQQAAKINALSLECQAFEKQILTLSNQMEQFQSDGKKRMEQSDAVHKEILAMLEKRTESDKNGGKKKQPNKGKKPPKPIEIQ